MGQGVSLEACQSAYNMDLMPRQFQGGPLNSFPGGCSSRGGGLRCLLDSAFSLDKAESIPYSQKGIPDKSEFGPFPEIPGKTA